MSQPPQGEQARAAVDVVIRFKDSAATLPAVLEALSRQTFRDYRIVGVDTGSGDASPDLIRQAGGIIVRWEKPYSHPGALNFGLEHSTAALVLALSSHTAFTEPEVLARMVAAFDDPAVACASGKWDEDAFYSDSVDLAELKAKGLKIGSIYSNSMGMIRRSMWQEIPFDETIAFAEDYAWAVDQLARGRKCVRLSFPFSYERTRHGRSYPVSLAVFTIAKRHGLKTAWLGPRGTFQKLAGIGLKRLFSNSEDLKNEFEDHRGKLRAWREVRKS